MSRSGNDGHQEGLRSISRAAELAELLTKLNPQVVSYQEVVGWAYDELGVLQMKDGQKDEARASLKKAIEILKKCPYRGLAQSALDEAREQLASLGGS